MKTDPGIVEVFYLQENSPKGEIRLLEVNKLIPESNSDLEPLNFGVTNREISHKLMVVDITPAQLDKIRQNQLDLPNGWSMDGGIVFRPETSNKDKTNES